MKMGTYTGRKIDLATMTKDDIDLTDITISLSRLACEQAFNFLRYDCSTSWIF